MINTIDHKKANNGNWKGYEDISGTIWRKILWHARKRHIDFDLTIEDAWDVFILQGKCCALTGLLLEFGNDKRYNSQPVETTASLDRIDNARGYTKENIQWVHKDINLMKLDHDQAEFIKWCKLVAKHNEN